MFLSLYSTYRDAHMFSPSTPFFKFWVNFSSSRAFNRCIKPFLRSICSKFWSVKVWSEKNLSKTYWFYYINCSKTFSFLHFELWRPVIFEPVDFRETLYTSFKSPKTVRLTQNLKLGVGLSSKATDWFWRGRKHMGNPVFRYKNYFQECQINFWPKKISNFF